MSGLKLDVLRPFHAGVAAELHARAMGAGDEPAWSEASLAALLVLPTVRGWLALSLGQPVGLVLLQDAGDDAEILTIAVAPGARRQGIGRALLSQAAALAESHGLERLLLEVAADNEAALALYASCGFESIGTRPGYYARPGGRAADALVMARGLARL